MDRLGFCEIWSLDIERIGMVGVVFILEVREGSACVRFYFIFTTEFVEMICSNNLY